MAEWLSTAAQQQGFTVAILFAGLLALWREVAKKDKTIRSMSESSAAAQSAVAVAMEKGANATALLANEIAAQRREFTDLRTEVLRRGRGR